MKFKIRFFFLLLIALVVMMNVKINAKTAVSNNYDCTYEEDVNTAKSITEILNDIELSAEDEYDGVLTEAINVEDVDNYALYVCEPDEIEKRNLGTYKVVCTVKDSSNNIATITIHIVVKDKVAPVFLDSGKYSYELDIDNINLTDDQILSNALAYDEFDSEGVTKAIVTGSVTKLERKKDISQTIVIKATDSSGNYVTKDIKIVLKDKTAPIITVNNTEVSTSYSANLSIETILTNLNLKVSDNYDENVTYDFYLDDYTEHKNKVGSYSVILEAFDEAGNCGQKTITVKVEDTIPPVFYLNESKISVYVETSTTLTQRDFIALLKKTNRLKSDNFDIFELKNEYQDNEENSGVYKYNVRLAYGEDDVEDYQFIVHVIEKVVENHPSFLTRIWNVIKKIGLLILNILLWPINKIKEFF